MVFRPNEAMDFLRKDQILAKKIHHGDATWYIKKVVLAWELDTRRHHLSLTPNQKVRVKSALDVIPSGTHRVSLCKQKRLLGILRSIAPAVVGAQGVFTQLQNALTQDKGLWVLLYLAENNELFA